MKKRYFKYFLLAVCLGMFVNLAEAQTKKRTSSKRTSTRKTAASRTKAKIQPTTPQVDTMAVAAVQEAPAPVVLNDSLPIKQVKKSLRPDEAVETTTLKDRTPLPYENLRADDAMYRHKIWREIDTREKINLPFKYAADENNGNQRFISILFKAIQDSLVTVFDASIDDRFTTPLTKGELVKKMAGDPIQVPLYDSNGVVTGYKTESRDIVLDSFYKFRIKEEVIFDKESSRLFWRILGIAPVMNVYTAQTNQFVGTTELFWVYYPDMRPIFSKYDVYNGKNYGARMSWEDLFESRMFYGRIIKSTIDNPYDRFIDQYPGLKDKSILQLLEGENIKEKIFNYEQDLWSY